MFLAKTQTMPETCNFIFKIPEISKITKTEKSGSSKKRYFFGGCKKWQLSLKLAFLPKLLDFRVPQKRQKKGPHFCHFLRKLGGVDRHFVKPRGYLKKGQKSRKNVFFGLFGRTRPKSDPLFGPLFDAKHAKSSLKIWTYPFWQFWKRVHFWTPFLACFGRFLTDFDEKWGQNYARKR